MAETKLEAATSIVVELVKNQAVVNLLMREGGTTTEEFGEQVGELYNAILKSISAGSK